MGFDLASAVPEKTQGFDLASAAPFEQNPSHLPDEFSLAGLGRQAMLAGRSVLNGIASVPLMAMDAGVAVRNTAENAAHGVYPSWNNLNPFSPEGYQAGTYGHDLPSQIFNQGLNDLGVPQPQSPSEKGAGFVESVLSGARMPAPAAANQAPAAFTRAVTSPRQLTLEGSQNKGYVIPPSTTNPTVSNKLLESLGGKAATAQDARAANQEVTDQLARKSLGLAEDEPITVEALKQIRTEASSANAAIRKTGIIKTDESFQKDIDSVLAEFKSAGGVSDKLAQTEVREVAESLKKEFPASDAVDAIKVLRERASAAYAKGDKETGKGLRSLSSVLEDQVERHLESLGKDGTDLLKRFREGRTLIAKTFTVESALNPATGNVSATKLASQLTKGKPLSGDLKTAAKFGQAFPKAAAPLLDSGGVRNTDVALGGLAAVMERSTWPLLYPFARLGARAGLLSPAGQKMAISGQMGNGVSPSVLMGTGTAEELLGQ